MRCGSSVHGETIKIDLNAPVQLRDMPAVGAQVWRWWLDEIGALLPPALRARLPKARPVVELKADGGEWRLTSGGQSFVLDPALADKDLTASVLTAVPEIMQAKLVAVLPAQGLLRRRIPMPLMPEASLHSAVELQIDRLSPFQADAVRFDARIHMRDAVEGTMLVDVAIAPRAPVELLEERLGALGLKPWRIDVASPEGDASGFDLRTRSVPAGGGRARLITLAFAAVAVVAWYFALYAWGAARERELNAWRATIDELRPVAARSAALRRALEGLAEPQRVAAAHVPGLALNPLLEATNLLPDDVRLSEFRLTGDMIDLTGLSADPPGLIAKLEASKLFKDVKFHSPVTRRPDLGKDRFEISMKLERGR